MKITFIGQAGLIIETEEKTVIIDPYLSDSVERVNPSNFRRVPVNEEIFGIRPDVLIFTHDHLDHYDPETAEKFLKSGAVTVLCPDSVWQKVRKNGGAHNYVCVTDGVRWTQDGIVFRFVKACHSDPFAVGVIISAEGKNLYITGDTLYNINIVKEVNSLGIQIDAVFLPINGVGNNMNMVDASAFAADIAAKKAVPMHTGMFDKLNADDFPFVNKAVPKIYKEIEVF